VLRFLTAIGKQVDAADAPAESRRLHASQIAANSSNAHWVHHDEAARVNQLLIDFFGR
jgi:hypothetical protein